MKRHLSLQDKKAVSLVIGYVLLIVLALSMGTAVYFYLQNYIPKEQAQCYEGTSIAIKNVSCSGSKIRIALVNKGLFTIDGVLIKAGERDSVFKTIVNCPGSTGPCRIYFNESTAPYASRSLKPGENFTGEYSYNYQAEENEIEIEPLIKLDNSEAVLCEKAIISRAMKCFQAVIAMFKYLH